MPSRVVASSFLPFPSFSLEFLYRPCFLSEKKREKRKKKLILPDGISYVPAAEIREALQHAIKVSREGSCQWPRPRVIPVRDVYPSPSTTYVPHCAILHRCSDDTGCCRSEALTCVPKHSHRVELSFYVSTYTTVVHRSNSRYDVACYERG